MGVIRKIKRIKESIKAHKEVKKKLAFLDVWLTIGLAMFVVGILSSFSFYSLFGGRPEGIINTEIGSFPVEKIEAGNSNYLDMTILCAIIAVIGLVISGICLLVKNIRKQTQNPTSNTFNL
jgi:hypothetical protein